MGFRLLASQQGLLMTLSHKLMLGLAVLVGASSVMTAIGGSIEAATVSSDRPRTGRGRSAGCQRSQSQQQTLVSRQRSFTADGVDGRRDRCAESVWRLVT